MGEIELANLFSWATTNPPNWLQGILYVVLGVFGALVTIYFVIGGTIPTASGAKLESEFKELEKKNKELAELRQKALENPSTANPALIDAFSNDADKQRDDLERKRQGMFRSWSLFPAAASSSGALPRWAQRCAPFTSSVTPMCSW